MSLTVVIGGTEIENSSSKPVFKKLRIERAAADHFQ